MHDFQEQCQIGSVRGVYLSLFVLKQFIIKHLDSVYVLSGIIRVSRNKSYQPRPITFNFTLIIQDSTRISSNNYLLHDSICMCIHGLVSNQEALMGTSQFIMG